MLSTGERKSPSSSAATCATSGGQVLLTEGADVHIGSENGSLLLRFAAREGKTACVETLLRHSVDPWLPDEVGATALMLAAKTGQLDVVKMLLASGADVNAKDNEGRRAVAYASSNGHKDVVRALVSHQPASTSNSPNGHVDQAPVKRASSKDGAAGAARVNLTSQDGVAALVKLLRAAGAGDEGTVDEVLRSSELDVNASFDDMIPLVEGVKGGHVGMVRKLLVEYRANPNITFTLGNGGTTCLMLAAGGGDEEIVRLLLEHGANVNVKDSTGHTAFMAAILGEDVVALRILPLLKAHGADLSATNSAGATLLMMAAIEGKIEVIRYLLAHGADPTARDINGRDAIAWAKMGSQGPEVVGVLTEAMKAHMERRAAQFEGQEEGEEQMPKDKNPNKKVAQTPKTSSSEDRAAGGVTHDLTPREVDGALAMLVEAAYAGDEAKVDEVLRSSPELDVNEVHEGKTALIWAVFARHVGVVRKLLAEYRADPNVTDERQYTCLMRAAGENDEELVRLLLEHGANVHAKDMYGYSAVHYAIRSVDVVSLRSLEVLKAHGGDFTAADDAGIMALMWAAFLGKMEVVRYLLVNGADPTARDCRGMDAIAWAKKGRRTSSEIVAVLSEAVKAHVERLAAQIQGPLEGEAETRKDKKRTKKKRGKGGGVAVASDAQAGEGGGAVDMKADAADVGVARVPGGDEEQQLPQVTAAVAVASLHGGEAESFAEEAEAQGSVRGPVSVDDEEVKSVVSPVELTEEDFDDAPTLFECPISHTIMRDPVTAQDGYSYERSHIETWIRKAVEDGVQPRSPMTNEPMDPMLAPTRVLKFMVDEYLQRKLTEKKARLAAAAQA